jgi:hypothetical protein
MMDSNLSTLTTPTGKEDDSALMDTLQGPAERDKQSMSPPHAKEQRTTSNDRPLNGPQSSSTRELRASDGVTADSAFELPKLSEDLLRTLAWAQTVKGRGDSGAFLQSGGSLSHVETRHLLHREFKSPRASPLSPPTPHNHPVLRQHV